MVQLSYVIPLLFFLRETTGLVFTNVKPRIAGLSKSRADVILKIPNYRRGRSHWRSISSLTSTHVEAKKVHLPMISWISARASLSSLFSFNRSKKGNSLRLFIATLLVAIMIFGPGFSPAANASITSTVFSTHSRALGTFQFFPTKAELELCFRLLYAACSGAFIGLERSSSDRPAGVRTMALVGLGACMFTVCSTHGFLPHALGYIQDSPMLNSVKCDPSRMASNVASGVGFIGAGAIHNSKLHSNGAEHTLVEGLTTAAAIWVSAAVGVASAVGLYFLSSVAAFSTVSILRFAKVTKDNEPELPWKPRALEIDEDLIYSQETDTTIQTFLLEDKQAALSGLFGYNTHDDALGQELMKRLSGDYPPIVINRVPNALREQYLHTSAGNVSEGSP